VRLIRDTKIDFIGKRRWAFLVSGSVIVPGLISILLHGGLHMGVDFTGGVQLQVTLVPAAGATGAAPVDIAAVRRAVNVAGYDDRSIQHVGSRNENSFLIHVPVPEGGGETAVTLQVRDRIIATLQEQLPEYNVDPRRLEVQSIGPKISSELRTAAVQATVLTVLLILGYIAWRFEFRFGVATVVAMIHDLVFCIGAFSLLGKEFTLSVLAALLTLVGYSVNDTIVVFDRIREELKIKQRRESYDQIFNGAINKTLSRTVLTGTTTLLVILSLYFLGGDVIHDFVWVMLVGIIVGTYSSIAVAAPLVIEWQAWSERREAARAASGGEAARRGGPKPPVPGALAGSSRPSQS